MVYKDTKQLAHPFIVVCTNLLLETRNAYEKDLKRDPPIILVIGWLSLCSLLPEPQTEVLLHKRKPVTQLDLGFPPEQLLCPCDVGLPLSRIIGCVLNHGDLHIGIDKLHTVRPKIRPAFSFDR